MIRQTLAACCVLALLAGCSDKKGAGLLAETSPNAATTVAPPKAAEGAPSIPSDAANLPAGDYKLDPAHASLIFKIDHMGFSNYTARFGKFDAQMQLDPTKPEGASVTATVDANSLELNSPPPGFPEQIKGAQFLDAKKFPTMSFKSTKIDPVNGGRAHLQGDFTMHGVTKPVTLEAKFNGGYPGMTMDPHARIGFSARGSLKRSDFGIDAGLPQPGSKMGVGDEVEIYIEAEFSGPEWKGAAAAPAAPAPK